MPTTYNCPVCRKVCLTEKAAAEHCAKEKCKKCDGTGIIVGFLGPNQVCPVCKGSGIV